MNIVDPTGLASKDVYYCGLDQNYKPQVLKDNEITYVTNISEYIEHDPKGNPYTNENGAALFNEKGIAYLKDKGWTIEALDTFHEEGVMPVVKLTHNDGGEQIYNMFGGDIVDNEEFGGFLIKLLAHINRPN